MLFFSAGHCPDRIESVIGIVPDSLALTRLFLPLLADLRALPLDRIDPNAREFR
jgi:hypothetical protein